MHRRAASVRSHGCQSGQANWSAGGNRIVSSGAVERPPRPGGAGPRNRYLQVGPCLAPPPVVEPPSMPLITTHSTLFALSSYRSPPEIDSPTAEHFICYPCVLLAASDRTHCDICFTTIRIPQYSEYAAGARQPPIRYLPLQGASDCMSALSVCQVVDRDAEPIVKKRGSLLYRTPATSSRYS